MHIKYSKTKVNSVLNNLDNNHQNLNQEIVQLEQLLDSLSEFWSGQAHDEFINKNQRMIEKMKALNSNYGEVVDLMKQYNLAMNHIDESGI